MLTPRTLQAKRLGNRIEELLEEEVVSLDDLLTMLDEERERYY